jgi:hypothetical protein
MVLGGLVSVFVGVGLQVPSIGPRTFLVLDDPSSYMYRQFIWDQE